MRTPDWGDMLRVFGRIGILSFGGPAAQIGLMHRELVQERGWLDEASYLRALSLCMLLPGPEAMQLATYAGWRLRGVPGGLLAGLLFVLPGAAVIAALALLYAHYGQMPLVQAAFLGIKAAVVIVVIQALRRLGGKALAQTEPRVIGLLGFIAILALGLPFPLIVAAAGIWGFLRAQPADDTGAAQPARAAWGASLRTGVFWGALWLAPLIALSASDAGLLAALGWFFAKLAVVTFGGAYAVLGYMTQQVVQNHGWITTAQMIDALGLAETTPGPLILVTQFVAMLAGGAQGGAGLALLGGLVALWATFVPCFFWIFAAAPHLEALARRPRLSAALAAITAAVVGVIANLTLWFALHVLFASVGQVRFGPVSLPVPDPGSLDPAALVLMVLAGVAMVRFKLPMAPALGAMALAGIALNLALRNMGG